MKYQDHTDTVADKIKRLQEANRAKDFDLALSLADSLKDTLRFEKQRAAGSEKVDLIAENVARVSDLPRPWAEWAKGWTFYQTVTLFETVGIERVREPVELRIAVPSRDASDLSRELRVARLDAATGTLREVTSQVIGETRNGSERRCRVLLAADVPAHEQARYFLFYGNPSAELPEYPSNLLTSGEGYGLDISNEHYAARLSRQTGQLERLTFKREHGLELYAGGKGHGEPPNIDWGHDYVDQDGFQKLRMRNWSECPNYEVARGPLCVELRRWGFPHSPLHPLFMPSRIQLDVTYHFFAGQPYFCKESRFNVIEDVSIEAMRDDEWVFSGFSFDRLLWIDRAGKLHEGDVPKDQSSDLWGVGFYHSASRDAFVALRLDHSAEGFDGLRHGGVPTLFYAGHGQLWSRYPVDGKTTLKKGANIRQKNAYLVAPFPETGAAARIERLRHQLQSPLVIDAKQPQRSISARAEGSLARRGETADTASLKPAVWAALKEIKDEQFYTIDANVVDLGLVYDVRERNGVVRVTITMPHRGRPVYQFFASQGGGRISEGIRERLLRLPGVRDVIVELTWNPAWDVHRLTDAGRNTLGLPG